VRSSEIPESEIDALYERLRTEALASGYFLNPDAAFARDLVRSLIFNNRRYGYPSCPCRLSSGKKEEDSDIICPCDYRDPDIAEHGACLCALYVSESCSKGAKPIEAVPERRPAAAERARAKPRQAPTLNGAALSYPVWRCRVCGYLCARDEPPDLCPVCKAKKDRFERFM
jgi:ferredoxin-thioredoxin reductase catalytic subunit